MQANTACQLSGPHPRSKKILLTATSPLKARERVTAEPSRRRPSRKENILSQTLANSPHARDIASVLHPQTNLRKHLQVGPSLTTAAAGTSPASTTATPPR